MDNDFLIGNVIDQVKFSAMRISCVICIVIHQDLYCNMSRFVL